MTTVIHRIRMTSIIQTVGHSRDEKKANHERILEIAAARMRESGTEAPGVAEIMRAAGLTHGGFYKHFDSRDQLDRHNKQQHSRQAGSSNLGSSNASSSNVSSSNRSGSTRSSSNIGSSRNQSGMSDRDRNS